MFLQLSSLWSGEFGIVYKGYIVEDTTDIVAIKTLKGYSMTVYKCSYSYPNIQIAYTMNDRILWSFHQRRACEGVH